MNILGLNAFHGDASAALLCDGQLVSALEEERLNRVKHWAGFPALAAQYCLEQAHLSHPDHVAISRNPRAHLGRKIFRVMTRPGDWGRTAGRAKNSVRVARVASDLGKIGLTGARKPKVHYVEHHRAHLASTFFASPFEEAAVVSVDGFGDLSSVMWGVGQANRINVMGSVQFPHSLGLFYTAFTQLLGFNKYGDEYKMMGLAAYGEPRLVSKVREVVRTEGTQVYLDLDYFVHHTAGVDMTWDGGEPRLGLVYSPKLLATFGQPRVPGQEIEQHHADLAASVQVVLEDCYFDLLNAVQARTGQAAVCLAGGVALNCAANGKIFERTAFRDVYIQAASHDAGTSIGAALYVHHQVLGQPRSFVMEHVYYGPEYSPHVIRHELDEQRAEFLETSEDELIRYTAAAIADGNIVGWFQGRMEFGPRALGARSILADPRNDRMKDTLNARIKFREPFRPFCPSVLAEATGDFFESSYPSPFMVQAYRIKAEKQKLLPAVTHADGTGRLQTVERSANPLYWKLIKQFGNLTGVPVLLNTSFNENEPIVNTPAQALDCFLRTNMDMLVIGPYILRKADNQERARNRQIFAHAATAH